MGRRRKKQLCEERREGEGEEAKETKAAREKERAHLHLVAILSRDKLGSNSSPPFKRRRELVFSVSLPLSKMTLLCLECYPQMGKIAPENGVC